MKINKEKLFELYMQEIDEISEVCDWKTHFEPEEIVSILAGILEKNPDLITKE